MSHEDDIAAIKAAGEALEHMSFNADCAPKEFNFIVNAIPASLRVVERVRVLEEALRDLRRFVRQPGNDAVSSDWTAYYEMMQRSAAALASTPATETDPLDAMHEPHGRGTGVLVREGQLPPLEFDDNRIWHCRFHPTNWWHEVGCPHVKWQGNRPVIEPATECEHDWQDQRDRWLRLDGASPQKCSKCCSTRWVPLPPATEKEGA